MSYPHTIQDIQTTRYHTQIKTKKIYKNFYQHHYIHPFHVIRPLHSCGEEEHNIKSNKIQITFLKETRICCCWSILYLNRNVKTKLIKKHYSYHHQNLQYHSTLQKFSTAPCNKGLVLCYNLMCQIIDWVSYFFKLVVSDSCFITTRPYIC